MTSQEKLKRGGIMKSENLQHQALLEVVGPKVLADWIETAQSIKAIISDKLKSEADENGMIPKLQVTAAITVMSQVAASFIKLTTTDTETIKILKEAFTQGVEFWIGVEEKEASV